MRKASLGCVCAGVAALVVGAQASAAEFGERTPYYEDDAWYDVTEWLDANDYNPTDEAWWRWDDETYQAAKDTSGDRDSDGSYGYTANADDDWYYDYYDPFAFSYFDRDADGVFDFGYRYYDYDADGLYDAYASYTDVNDDGEYEDFAYYSFGEAGAAATGTPTARESRQRSTTGRITKMKMVKVPGGNQHVVVSVEPKSGAKEQAVVADLGSKAAVNEVNPKLGDTITVKGPLATVGKQAVVLTKSFELNGKTRQVDREARRITGEVLSTHRAKVRGAEHLMAIVQTGRGDQAKKMVVDLGRADRLKVDVAKGKQLTFSAFHVKVNDKPLMMARAVQMGDKTVRIDRQPDIQRRQARKGS